MIMKVIGVKRVDYTNKRNERVVGCELTVASEFSPENGIGYSANNYFIKDGRLDDFPLKEIYTVLFEPTPNGYQRCVGVLYKDDKK